jgi:hypothetical protein
VIHKTPSLDAPMSEDEVALAHGAWQAFQNYVASLPREPDMITLLETFSQVVERCFNTRSMANQAFKLAEARYFGDNRITPFRRGVAPKAPTPRAPKGGSREDLLKTLGITEEQLQAEMRNLNLLSSPKGDPGDQT